MDIIISGLGFKIRVTVEKRWSMKQTLGLYRVFTA